MKIGIVCAYQLIWRFRLSLFVTLGDRIPLGRCVAVYGGLPVQSSPWRASVGERSRVGSLLENWRSWVRGTLLRGGSALLTAGRRFEFIL